MRDEDSRKCVADVEIEYTSKPLSGWGGLNLVGRFFETLKVRDWLVRALPDGRTSPNQVPVVDMALQVMATVLSGGSRFAHVDRIKSDEVVKTCFGAERFGDPMTVTRYFGGFRRSDSDHLQKCLREQSAGLLVQDRKTDVVDLDGSVFTRCGSQEGALVGYNPSRRGRQSHQVLLAILAHSKFIAHSWMLSGNASLYPVSVAFFKELMAELPANFTIEAVRADSGFCSTEFIDFLEEKGLPYTIALRMTLPIKRWTSALSGWTSIEGGETEITEGMYAPHYWAQGRRVIVWRKKLRTRKKGLLFDLVEWDYYAIVTTLSLPAAEVLRFYNKRGDAENRIKELKYDFNADGFCLRNFHGTEAVFRLTCFLFNLIAAFKRLVLHDSTSTLSTIRSRVFVIGAILGSRGRQAVLRLGLVHRWQTEFKTLLDRLASLSISTVAQLRNLLDEHLLDKPSPWRARSRPALFLVRR